jgi:chromosome partitioning protein
MPPRITAVANQKGGTGKTTTTTGLAAALAELGLRVLIVDNDPQHSATSVFDVNPDDPTTFTLFDLMAAENAAHPLAAAITATTWPGVSLVPGCNALAARERSPQIGDEFLLRKLIAAGAGDVDHILIDCPSSLGMLTLSALIAAEDVVLVTKATFLDLQATIEFLQTMSLVRENYNRDLTLAGCIVNMWRRTKEQNGYLEELTQALAASPEFAGEVWLPPVPMTVAAEASAAEGMPLSMLRRSGAAGLRDLYRMHACRLAGIETAEGAA